MYHHQFDTTKIYLKFGRVLEVVFGSNMHATNVVLWVLHARVADDRPQLRLDARKIQLQREVQHQVRVERGDTRLRLEETRCSLDVSQQLLQRCLSEVEDVDAQVPLVSTQHVVRQRQTRHVFVCIT